MPLDGKMEENGEGIETPLLAGFTNLILTFNGEEKNGTAIINYFKKVETVAKLAKWTDEVKLLIAKSKLRGKANELVEQNETLALEQNYDEFKVKLIKLFGDQENLMAVMSHIMECKQKSDESVYQFSLRINSLAQKAARLANSSDPLYDSHLIHLKFIRGLNCKLRRVVLSNKGDSYEETVKRALEEEKNEEICKDEAKVNLTEVEEFRGLKKQVENLTVQFNTVLAQNRQLFEDLNASTGREKALEAKLRDNESCKGEPARKIPLCYKCNKAGHFIKDCPEWGEVNKDRNQRNLN